MLRNLIAWDRRNDEAWEDTMRRMKIKLDRALKIQPIQLWADTAIKRKWIQAYKILNMHESRWANKISNFDPSSCMQDETIEIAKRKRGRPRIRWEDDLNSFANYYSCNH